MNTIIRDQWKGLEINIFSFFKINPCSLCSFVDGDVGYDGGDGGNVCICCVCVCELFCFALNLQRRIEIFILKKF